jgi:2-aminoadipate transaminase
MSTPKLLDFEALLAPGLPPAAAKWTGFAKYNFIGGHNDADQLPLDALIQAANDVFTREGRTLATYGLSSGPLGYRRLREFLAQKVERTAGIRCDADEILITSGSLQALDLVNGTLLSRGDTVIIEQATYQGALTRLQRLGVEAVGIPLDADAMRMDALAAALDALKRRGVRPKYIYTIPTIQNPTGTILSEARRHEMLRLAAQHGIPIFEDDCYSDLIWDGKRPPALYATSRHGGVIHIGSFSKSVAPALRVGYIVAPWPLLARMLPLKTDAGSGALEQMVLGEFCPAHFDAHVPALTRALRAKLETLMDALNQQFGTAAEFDDPKGGIFLWVKLPDQVDTQKLFAPALAGGVAINPGADWSIDKEYGKSRTRLCFANPSHETIRAGIARSPKCAAPNSACRRGSPMCSGRRREEIDDRRHCARWARISSDFASARSNLSLNSHIASRISRNVAEAFALSVWPKVKILLLRK